MKFSSCSWPTLRLASSSVFNVRAGRYYKLEIKEIDLVRFAGFASGGSIWFLICRLGILFYSHVTLVKLDGLFIILSCIKVHFWLYLEHEVPSVSAKCLCTEIVFLDVHVIV